MTTDDLAGRLTKLSRYWRAEGQFGEAATRAGDHISAEYARSANAAADAFDDAAARLAAQDRVIGEMVGAAGFLCDRLDDFEATRGCDLDDDVREFSGHVSPALSRMKTALAGRDGRE